MSRPTILLFLLAAACDGQHTVAVQVLVPDLAGHETPLPGILVTALPFNRDSILAALEARTRPRPHTPALDSLFQAFRVPFLAFARTAWTGEQLRDRRTALASEQARATSPAARGEIAAQLRSLDDSLRSTEQLLDRQRTALAAARDTLWPRIERLRSEVQQWELSAFADYDSVIRSLTRQRYNPGLSDTTDAQGWVRLVLPAGRWWITTRTPDPQDPNAQWHWNLPVAGDTIRLSPANARHLSRY